MFVPLEDGGCLAVAVRDGVAELSRAVLLPGTAGRVVAARGAGVPAEALAEELLRDGAPSRDEAIEQARRFLDELRARGLANGEARTPGEGPAAPADRREERPGATSSEPLEATDLERLAREVLGRGLGLRYRALGRSMRPAIPHGSVLDVVGRAFAAVRVGEVALYSTGETRLVAHRIVGRRDGRLLARGDSSARLDEVTESDYLGVVRARIAPDGSAVRVSSGMRRVVGLAAGAGWRGAAFLVRLLVVRPLRRTFRGPSLLRAALWRGLRLASNAAYWTERALRRGRVPLEVAGAALLTPDEKDADRAQLYRRGSVQAFTAHEENIAAGLTLIEEVLLARHAIEPGRTLVVACGPGRECLALARRGFVVVGADREEGMLERARALAAEAGLPIEFVRADALDLRVEGEPFDLVVLFSGLVNMVLPRARRVALLERCRDHLRPGGRVLLTFLSAYRRRDAAAPPPGGSGFWGAVNPDHEPGDRYEINEAIHLYPSAEDLAAEARAAGLEVLALERDQRAYDRAEGRVRGYAVLHREP